MIDGDHIEDENNDIIFFEFKLLLFTNLEHNVCCGLRLKIQMMNNVIQSMVNKHMKLTTTLYMTHLSIWPIKWPGPSLSYKAMYIVIFHFDFFSFWEFFI